MSLISLRRSYTLIAPLYDAVLAGAGTGLRAASLAQLPPEGNLRILISGIGTGLDIPYLPVCHQYVGLDLTTAMLDRANSRVGHLQLDIVRGDSMSLPFANESFDYVVLHLILAIVPDAPACLRESARAETGRKDTGAGQVSQAGRAGRAPPLAEYSHPTPRYATGCNIRGRAGWCPGIAPGR
jgi:hypothetical protein